MSQSPADRALQAGALTESGVPLRDGEVPGPSSSSKRAPGGATWEKRAAIAEEGPGAAAGAGLAGASAGLAGGTAAGGAGAGAAASAIRTSQGASIG